MKTRLFIEDEPLSRALSVDGYRVHGSVVWCPLLPPNSSFSATADLRWNGGRDQGDSAGVTNVTLQYWEKTVYEAAVDGDMAVVFVKGLNLWPHRRSDSSPFTYHFRSEGETKKAVSAAQEAIRCLLLRSVRRADPAETRRIRVTIGVLDSGGRGPPVRELVPSVARIVTVNGFTR